MNFVKKNNDCFLGKLSIYMSLLNVQWFPFFILDSICDLEFVADGYDGYIGRSVVFILGSTLANHRMFQRNVYNLPKQPNERYLYLQLWS